MALLEGLLERIDNALDGVAPGWSQRRPQDDDDAPDRQQSAFNGGAGDPADADNGDIVINGVVLPRAVADQLRMLGVSLSWYSKGQLEAAINGCAVDCNLVDDPDGISFFDDLVLDEREREEEDGDIDFDPFRLNRLGGQTTPFSEPDEYKKSVYYDPTFRERIKAERERERDRRKQSGESRHEDKSDSFAMHGG